MCCYGQPYLVTYVAVTGYVCVVSYFMQTIVCGYKYHQIIIALLCLCTNTTYVYTGKVHLPVSYEAWKENVTTTIIFLQNINNVM